MSALQKPPGKVVAAVTGVHPAAVVVERRATFGAVCTVEVACPFGKHRHAVGVTDGSAVLWCSYTGRTYQVTVEKDDR